MGEQRPATLALPPAGAPALPTRAQTHTQPCCTTRPQAERDAEASSTIAALEASRARLASEAEEAALAAEVLAAKGRAYDDLEAHAGRLVRSLVRGGGTAGCNTGRLRRD